jgi:signal transduction histidine kinase
VATPIFDQTGAVTGVLAASISAETLRERVFQTLKESSPIANESIFYLVDRHGHVVASSSGKHIYFPFPESENDERDQGNLRGFGFFKQIEWTPDILEKGNLWERGTQSWRNSSLDRRFEDQYISIDGTEVFGNFQPTSILDTKLNWGILIETPAARLREATTRIRYLFLLTGTILTATLTTLFIQVFRSLNHLERNITNKEQEIDLISNQVAHDIRSPLAALEVALKETQSLNEECRTMIRGAANRIRDIANNLVNIRRIPNKIALDPKPNPSTSGKRSTPERPNQENQLHALMEEGVLLAAPALQEIISEKKLQFKHIKNLDLSLEIPEPLSFTFISAETIEFKRLISNLINNSIEAFEPSSSAERKIELTAQLIAAERTAPINTQRDISRIRSQSGSSLRIQIKDNGKGIPASVLPKLLKKGASFGKEGGSGLGLFHAQRCAKAWGGSLDIASVEGKGTQVSLSLPILPAPTWFSLPLELSPNHEIIVLDDEPSIHQALRKKVDNLFNSDEKPRNAGSDTAPIMHHFYHPDSVVFWVNQNRNRTARSHFFFVSGS